MTAPFFYIRRDIFGSLREESPTYPTSTFGWYRVCSVTGEETRLV